MVEEQERKVRLRKTLMKGHYPYFTSVLTKALTSLQSACKKYAGKCVAVPCTPAAAAEWEGRSSAWRCRCTPHIGVHGCGRRPQQQQSVAGGEGRVLTRS